MMEFCLCITTREGHVCYIKKPPRETVQCIIWQSKVLKEPLDARVRIATGGNHEIGLNRNHVWSTGPWRPVPVYLQWKNRLCCWSNWKIFNNTRLCVMDHNLKELNLSQKIPWDLQMENTQLWKGDALLRLLSDLAVE